MTTSSAETSSAHLSAPGAPPASDADATGPRATATRPPWRHRSAERRNRRLGRPVRVAGRVGHVDEALLDEIGAGFHRCDPLGADLAAAMRLPVGHPDRVTMRTFREALHGGVTADAPPALRSLLEATSRPPAWLDRDLLARGQQIFHRFGRNAGDVLLQLSLIGGYRFGGPTELLVATGGLTGESTLRRLAETQHWTTSLTTPGGLEPGGEAWRLTLHVRAMHAIVNHTFTPRWDVGRWGLPINASDQAATLGLFDGAVLLGVRALGVPVPRDDAHAVMHLWRYVGWLLGVEERWLVSDERERHRLNYHLLLAQGDQTDAGRQLAAALVEVQRDLHLGPPQRLRGTYARERLLSMLTVFLGVRSMRELELPLRPPWAHLLVIARNLYRYRTARGRAGLDAWADRTRERELRRNFGGAPREVASLPAPTTPTP